MGTAKERCHNVVTMLHLKCQNWHIVPNFTLCYEAIEAVYVVAVVYKVFIVVVGVVMSLAMGFLTTRVTKQLSHGL